VPNTLCHIAIQTPLSRTACPQSDLLWVIIGCIIPDIPWIVQKILLATEFFNSYDLRLYFMVQASLFFCVLLSLSLSLLTNRSLPIFLILAINCLLHLLLDSLQIKWGNGIHLLAPLSWDMIHFDLFWPEHLPTQVISLLGIPVILYYWRSIAHSDLAISFASIRRMVGAAVLLLCYLVGPFIFIDQLEDSDSYYLQTMRQYQQRQGKSIEFDRAEYDQTTQTATYLSGEKFSVQGNLPQHSGRLSIQGYFADSTTIVVKNYHLHKDHRDLASIVGLFLACSLTVHSLLLTFRQKATNLTGP